MNNMKTAKLIMITLIPLLLTPACKDKSSSPGSQSLNDFLHVDLSAAVAVGGVESGTENGSFRSSSDNSTGLIKIDAEGIISHAFSGENIDFPSLKFLSVAADGSVILCYKDAFDVFDDLGNGYRLQMLKLTAENTVVSLSSAVTLGPYFPPGFEDKIYYSDGSSIYRYSFNSDAPSVIASNVTLNIKNMAVNGKGEVLALGVDGQDEFLDDTVLQYYTAGGDKKEIQRLTPNAMDSYQPLHMRIIISGNLDRFFILYRDLYWHGLHGAKELSITNAAEYDEYSCWGSYDAKSLVYEEDQDESATNTPTLALMIKDGSGNFRWSENVLDAGVVDGTKLDRLVMSYFRSSYSQKAGTLTKFQDSAQFAALVLELDESHERETFLSHYFNGTLLEDLYLDPYNLSGMTISSFNESTALNNISSLYLLDDGLYGVSDFFADVPFRVIRLRNSASVNDIELIGMEDRSNYDTGTSFDYETFPDTWTYKVVGNHIYFRYRLASANAVNTSALYDFGRFDMRNGNTEYFNDWLPELEIKLDSFAVSADERLFFFSGKRADGSTYNGRIDLTDRTVSELDNSFDLSRIDTF